MKKIIIFLVIIIVLIFGYFVIRDKKQDNYNNIVKIGASESLTGSASYYGEQARKGIDLAIESVNSKYQNLKFEVFHEDNQFNPKIALDTYNNLKVKNIDAIITHNSPSAIAIQPLAMKDGILQMAISSAGSKYTSANDLSFRTTGSTDLEVQPMVKYINKNFKKIAIVYMNNEIGLSMGESLKKYLEESKQTDIISFDAFLVDANDFRTVITKIKSSKPDAIYIAGLASHTVNFLKQMKEMNLSSKVLTFRTGEDPILIENSNGLTDGIVFTSNFDPDKSDRLNIDFVKEFQNKYGKKPDSYAAEGYEGARLIMLSFMECNKDYNCIKNYLINNKHNTIFGDANFDENGDIIYDFFLKTVKNGEFVKLEE